MTQAPGQPEQDPEAAADLQPATEPQEPRVLEYHGPASATEDDLPWFMPLAIAVTCGAAAVLTLIGFLGLFIISATRQGSDRIAAFVLLAALPVGVAMFLLEHYAIRRRSSASSVVLAAMLLIAGILFFLAAAATLGEGTLFLLPALLSLVALLCATAHFRWAYQLEQGPSRSWRV